MQRKMPFFLFIASFISKTLNAQNTRSNDYNYIGWFAYTGTVNINNTWSIHTEYQWRRDNVITDWQQIEGGFLSQIVQLPREINNRNVFQYNNGLIVHTISNF